MNITEAVRTQSLLAWIADCEPRPETTSIALVDARFLADRAQRALGAGPDADQVEAALRHRFGRRAGQAVTTEARLAQLAELLQPCPRPNAAAGWDLCAHAQPWPCVITRAAWIAADLDPNDGMPRR